MADRENRPRERELVLAPNEYAYVLDTTKGHINCYVGPNKTSLAQTDQLVIFNPRTKRFEPEEIQEAVRVFATAPANWYVEIKNPAKGDVRPSAGTSNAAVDLRIGEKINIPGPVSFALWPGQMARVVEGHRLRSNEYLYVRIYDAAKATEMWNQAMGLPSERPAPALTTGQSLIIRGTDVSFYLPPTGVEVVPDEQGRHVRQAATLQRLEYCILASEDGRKSYVRGEAVVFPEPTQRFVERQGRYVFQAIELSEITGLYVKVIAPYVDEEGVAHQEGEELFLTGKNVIYFPREEHAIIRYGGCEIHQAIAIPRGEGRYVLDRHSGSVSLVRGPCMFLPDPRAQVLTRRVLSDRECRLLYPGNALALSHNQGLRRGETLGVKKEAASTPDRRIQTTRTEEDGFSRPHRFEPPRAITLDTKYDGAVSVDVWSGYAVKLVDKSGARRVVVGPATVLLEYDEGLESLALSTGTPKSDEELLETVFLRVSGNKVSDLIELTSTDSVRSLLRLEYRVSFGGDDPTLWFAVDNYVKLLCDHASSIIKAEARKRPIRELKRDVTEIVRDVVLGKRTDAGRPALRFEENGMCVFDIEVLELEILDESVAALLSETQSEALSHAIRVAEREGRLAGEKRLELIERELAREAQQTQLHRLILDEEVRVETHRQSERSLERRLEAARGEHELSLELARTQAEVGELRRVSRLADHKLQLEEQRDTQALLLEELSARVEGTVRQAAAFTPQLVSALHRLGDQQLLSSLAGNFGELAAIEGRGLLDVAQKFLDFIPGSMVPRLSEPKNGKHE